MEKTPEGLFFIECARKSEKKADLAELVVVIILEYKTFFRSEI